jgi:hypothetical protein
MNNKTKNTPEFFFDTADTKTIRSIWDKLKYTCDPKSCVGITTNPNALAKVNCHTLKDFEYLVKEMADTVEDIRGADGLIYVQVPNSKMNESDILRWVEYISKLDVGNSKIALKLPHFSYILNLLDKDIFNNIYVNITGISDFGTICRVMNYDNVHYASIIPGRMEEVGIDANAHLRYLADTTFKNHQKIITGSMRTLEGLKSSIFYKTVPTIGTRVWDLFEINNIWNEFNSYWDDQYQGIYTEQKDFCPETTIKNINLSESFFEQMDGLGKNLYKNFCS